uniref:DUF1618 domain-containing protein n=1 Tax=Aegilops tauschii TaxID=37682 RepID=M8BKR2_AEGTA
MDKATPPPPQRLPEAALRLGVSLVGSGPHFEAMGNKIVIMGVSRTVDINTKRNDDDDFDDDDGHSDDNDHDDDKMITLVYNTKTAKLDIGRPTLERQACLYSATSAGDKLYMLVSDEPPLYLAEESVMPNLLRYESALSNLKGQMNEWAWKKSPTPLPLAAGAGGQTVNSHAVHPDGRTIFASVSSSLASPSFTFSFDTSKGGEPTRHHNWCLPFHGCAYYDGDLDAWVGIRKVVGRRRDDHYLCSCDVPDLGNDPATPLSEPAWRMCEEELTFLHGAITSPTLIHTGRGRFCLVEVMLAPSGSHCTCLQDGGEHLLRLTMFRAKHAKDGKLVVAPCRPGRSYLVPNYCYDRLGPPPAFWM